MSSNGINLHVAQDGPSAGPLVILLHGFPEFWYSWHRQIPHLAAAGYRVWAPDQRGYNLSDKPDRIAAYALDELAADVIGLMDAAGEEKAFIVGHDWGAAVAWWLAAKYPSRVARMVVLNVPHVAVMQEHLRRNLAQMRKSWYIFFFQLPWLPETLSRMRNWNIPAQALKNSSRPGTFTNRDLDTYRRAWSRPKAYTSMLNWYRAAMRRPPARPVSPRIKVPTLLIWGSQDRFLGREMAQPSIDLCDDGRLIFIEEASHWVHHEEAEQVNELINTFLRGNLQN
ncbi:MAG: alpha/beta hydrolase [Deltaproteobacteria bacterium]|nr:alpha/beta hydrolase [Deltaproteobacteria bacterium]